MARLARSDSLAKTYTCEGGKGGGKVHMAVDTLGQLLAAMR